jgi:hypothetical protein
MNRIASLVAATGMVCLTYAWGPPRTVDASGKQSAPSYAFTTLTVPGSTATDAWDINNRGEIVGHYVSDGTTHGFVRSADGSYFTLDAPGAVFTQATTINDRGEVAGTYRLPGDAGLRAFLRTTDGNFAAIDVPGASSTLPRGSNKHGEIVFEAVVDGHTTAYLLSEDMFRNIEPPGTFAGGVVTFSYASGINKHQAIVGRYDTAALGARGYLLDGAGHSHRSDAYTTLHFPGATSSAALGIASGVSSWAATRRMRSAMGICWSTTPTSHWMCRDVLRRLSVGR